MSAQEITVDGGTVVITEGAQMFMRRIARFGGSPKAGFRLVVAPGGCSGLSADFTVENDPLPGDRTLTVDGFRVFMPEASVKLLSGAIIDFSDSRTSQGLTFHQPNAPATCSDNPKPPLVKLSSKRAS